LVTVGVRVTVGVFVKVAVSPPGVLVGVKVGLLVIVDVGVFVGVFVTVGVADPVGVGVKHERIDSPLMLSKKIGLPPSPGDII
jgi:hypothetical protein